MTTRIAIGEVFTPRNQEINEAMYVHRPELEKELLRSIKKNTHTLIFGESGNGKSWLYKKVLSAENIPFVIANCANAARKNSLTKEICDAVNESGHEHNTPDFEFELGEDLLNCFKSFGGKDSGRKIIVLDNLESIFSKPLLMEELANLIILLDDSRYAKYSINFLIVGVPNGVLDYFSKTEHLDSVANRLEELSKIGGLTSDQVSEVINRGFIQLDVTFADEQRNSIYEHAYNVTLGIPQRVHEYCESLAYEVEDNNWRFELSLLDSADVSWLKKGLRKSYTVIQYHLNSRDTTVARRNQVLYSIGKIEKHQFDSGTIDGLIRRLFPETVPQTNMGVGSILSELSSGENPILSRSEKGNEYSVRDPRYRMCIRMMLYQDPVTKKVNKRGFNQK